MRYYELIITSPDGQATTTFSTLNADGSNNPMALRADIDVWQGVFHLPSQNSTVTIWGIPFDYLTQASDFNNCRIVVKGGMSKGLPLATPSQAGVLIQGTVLQAFGNYQGLTVNLNFVIVPFAIDSSTPANLSFNWQPGQTMLQAITNTLNAAYGLNVDPLSQLSESLVTPEPQPGLFRTMKSFTDYLNKTSKNILNQDYYLGCIVSVNTNGFYITDGTGPAPNTITVNYQDIIGNLTWLDIATIQAKLVMRSDVNVGDEITFPANAPTANTAAGVNQVRNLISFDGKFLVTSIRHVGSSRQKDANGWVTVIDAIIKGLSLS